MIAHAPGTSSPVAEWAACGNLVLDGRGCVWRLVPAGDEDARAAWQYLADIDDVGVGYEVTDAEYPDYRYLHDLWREENR